MPASANTSKVAKPASDLSFSLAFAVRRTPGISGAPDSRCLGLRGCQRLEATACDPPHICGGPDRSEIAEGATPHGGSGRSKGYSQEGTACSQTLQAGGRSIGCCGMAASGTVTATFACGKYREPEYWPEALSARTARTRV